MQNKPQRAFTRADLVAFFDRYWGKQENPKNVIQSLHLLPEIPSGGWMIHYVAIWNQETRSESVQYCTLVILQLARPDGSLYLNLPTEVDLPVGLFFPAEEDAEIKRRQEKSDG
jgi:hypothetical protein